MSGDPQRWVSQGGTRRRRKNPERDAEIARLIWVEGMSTVDVALKFAISHPRVSQIIWRPEFREMRESRPEMKGRP